MPDISNQMSYIQQLQDVRNPNSTMGALNQLAGSIGNTWQGYQGRTDEQDAIKFFMEKDVNPQTIQEFSSTHPQMPLMDVYKTAGTLATQKEAQSMKDMTKTLTNAISNGAQMDEKLIPSLFPNATPQQLGKFQTILAGMQQAGLNFKSLKEKDRFKPIGAQGLYDTETKGIIGQPAEKTTPLQDALRAKMREVDPDTTEPYTAAKAYSLVAHPVTPKESGLSYHIEKESVGDKLTQDYRVFVDKKGNVTKRDKVGVPYKNTEGVAEVRVTGNEDRSLRVFGAGLRKEFNNLPEIKEANLVMPKIKSMESAFEESKITKNFVAVDQALITLFNKLTDPSSVVRESEYARTAMNIPLINQIKGKVGKIMEGGAGLTSEERASLMKMAKLMQQGYMDIKGQRVKEYRGYASEAGLDGDKTIGDYGIAPEGKPPKALSGAGTATPPAKNKKGWVLKQDAKGNRAYVGPNNEIEEVR